MRGRASGIPGEVVLWPAFHAGKDAGLVCVAMCSTRRGDEP